jgi:aminopeptidase N
LRAAALSLLSAAYPEAAAALAQIDFDTSTNMTAKMGSLAAVLSVQDTCVDDMLERFYLQHQNDHLLVDKWFMLKAARATNATEIDTLTKHSAFTFKTPNRVYAVVGGFTGGNLTAFHAADGSGYDLLKTSIITLNAINPQVAARMANGFRSWGRYDAPRKAHAARSMQQILDHKALSNDVFEIISRTIKG